MDKFNNQFATQKLRQEMSVTSGGAGMTPSTVNNPVTQDWYTTKNKKESKKEEKDVEPKLAAGKAKVYMKDKWGWKDAQSIPNRKSKGGFIYKELFEELSYVAFNHYRSMLNDAYQELSSYNDQEGVKAVAIAYKSLDYTDAIDSIIKLNAAEKAIENSKLVPGQKSTYLTAIDGIRKYLIQKSTFKIVDSENRYFGRTAKIHDIHDDGTVMVIIDAPGNPTTTIDMAKLKSIQQNTNEELKSDKEKEFKIGDKVKHENQDWTIERILDNGGYRLKHSKGLPSVNVGAGDLKRQNKLNENYSKFKNETKTRGKSDQFHQAVRAVRKKVQEINKLFEYVSRLKLELSEGEDGLRYKEHTQKALAKIKEMVSELNQNIKKFK